MPRDLLEEDDAYEPRDLLAEAPAPKKEKRTGVLAVAEDVGRGLAEVPGAALDMLTSLPGELYGVAKQGLTNPKRIAQNAVAGLAEGGRGLLNVPGNTVDYLKERELIPDWMQAWRPEKLNEFDYGEGVGLEGHERGDELVRGLSKFAPNLFAGGPVRAGLLYGVGQDENPVTTALVPKVVGGTFKLGAKALSKAKNFKQGGLSPEAQELVNLGEEHKVPILAQDISRPGSTVDKLGRISEKPPIPFLSTVPERLKQQSAAQTAAKKIEGKYEKAMLDDTFGGPNGVAKLEQVAESGGKRAQAARNLLDDIQNAGEDWNYILKTSGNVELFKNKLIADEMYSNVGKIANKYGDISTSNAVRKVDGFLKDLNKLPETNADAIKALSAIRKDLVKKAKAEPASTVLDERGNPFREAVEAQEMPQNLSFNELRGVRSTLNDKISDFYTGKNTLIGKKGVGYLMRLNDVIEHELESFATKNGPELRDAWKGADTFYKDKVLPLKDSQLAKALKKETSPDEVYRMFIKNGGPEGDYGTGRARKFYNALDSKGQNAVRYGILKNALEHATDESGNFSLAKYATALEKLEASRAVFFKGAAKAELDGLTKLMRKVERAGQMKPPETGVQAVGYGLAAFFGNAHPGVTGAAAIGAYSLKKLLTTPKGRNFLYAASKLPSSSPKWESLQKNIKTYLESTSNALRPEKEESME